MTIPLDYKTKMRFLLLHKIYEITGGVAERHALEIKQIGDDMGVGPFVAIETFEFLRAEGLAKWVAAGYKGTITYAGLDEIKDALAGKRSVHFPANIIALANCPDAPAETDDAKKLRLAEELAASQAALAKVDATPTNVEQTTIISTENSEAGMRQLTEALSALRIAISKKVSTLDDYIELGKLASAEKAAINRDAPLVFDHLRQVTATQWGITCRIGIDVAVDGNTYKFIIDV